jgi:S1-C subfamily serine protease
MFVFSMSMAATAAQAADEGEAARAILGKSGDAVISVKATVKVRVVVDGNEQMKEENEVETLATVIDPSGLAVLSCSTIDPTRVYSGLLKKLKASGEGPQVDIKSEIAGLTMVMPDGQEIPAKVILRDGDLDVAFIRPTEKLKKPAAAIDISGESKPSVIDTVLVLGRLEKTEGRSPSVSLNRIEAVIALPRKVYVADSSTLMSWLGAPVFSLDGKLVGISLLRITKATDKSRMGSLLSGGMNALGIMPVILPAGDVSAVAKQAMEIKEK